MCGSFKPDMEKEAGRQSASLFPITEALAGWAFPYYGFYLRGFPCLCKPAPGGWLGGAHIQPTKYSQTVLKCCKEFRTHQLWHHLHTGTCKLSLPHVPRQTVLQVQHVSAVPVLLVRFAIASFLFWFIWLRSEYLVLWVKHKKCTVSSCFSCHKGYSMEVAELHGWRLEPDTQSSTYLTARRDAAADLLPQARRVPMGAC